MTTVELLYKCCEKLDAAGDDDVSKCLSVYNQIIKGVNGDLACKKLAAQLIVRYFHKFGAKDNALDALFELCESDDIVLRKTVVRDMVSLCNAPGDHVAKIIDVVTQLLQTSDTDELARVQQSLMRMLNNKNYTKETLTQIFKHIASHENEMVRERSMRFLAEKVPQLSDEVLTKEVCDFIVVETEKVLPKLNDEQFALCMTVLHKLVPLQTSKGRREIIEMLKAHLALDRPFDPSDNERVEQLVRTMRYAAPYMTKASPSNTMMLYLIDNLLPNLDKMRGDGTRDAAAVRLDILRVLAELALNSIKFDEKYLDAVKEQCMARMPDSLDANMNADEETLGSKAPYSELEALLYTMYQMVKHSPAYMTRDEKVAEYKNKRVVYADAKSNAFERKMNILARLAQGYHGVLQLVMIGKGREYKETGEYKRHQQMLRITENLGKILRAFLRKSYNEHVNLSWKTASLKRLHPDKPVPLHDSSVGNEVNVSKQRKSIVEPESYKLPSGKYSSELETLNEVITKRGKSVTGEIPARRYRDENWNSKYTPSGKHPRVQF